MRRFFFYLLYYVSGRVPVWNVGALSLGRVLDGLRAGSIGNFKTVRVFGNGNHCPVTRRFGNKKCWRVEDKRDAPTLASGRNGNLSERYPLRRRRRSAVGRARRACRR